MSMPDALVEKAAKAIHADVCCPADGKNGACVYPNDLWGDRHVARVVLGAVAGDIRAELLESGPLPEGWERHTYVRPQERYRLDDRTGDVYRPDGSRIDVGEWPSRVVIHGPWREGRHD